MKTISVRYAVREGSLSGHCCFAFTVVDTSKVEVLNAYRSEEKLCECWSKEDADKIVAALNAADC